VSLALLNRDTALRELTDFQESFHAQYAKWKTEFAHLIEVTYYCLCMEFYDVPVNHLYEGYFKNTEFETERNQPRMKQRGYDKLY
jgi:hypothetical protein